MQLSELHTWIYLKVFIFNSGERLWLDEEVSIGQHWLLEAHSRFRAERYWRFFLYFN